MQDRRERRPACAKHFQRSDCSCMGLRRFEHSWGRTVRASALAAGDPRKRGGACPCAGRSPWTRAICGGGPCAGRWGRGATSCGKACRSTAVHTQRRRAGSPGGWHACGRVEPGPTVVPPASAAGGRLGADGTSPTRSTRWKCHPSPRWFRCWYMVSGGRVGSAAAVYPNRDCIDGMGFVTVNIRNCNTYNRDEIINQRTGVRPSSKTMMRRRW
jgi:hypothetical protein